MTGLGLNDDPYADGWERGYLNALSDVAAEVSRLPDLTSRQKLQQIVVGLSTQMRFLTQGADR